MSPETAHHEALVTAAARFIPGDEGRPLFVWHHAPAADLRRGAGVVLCPPLGYEYMSAYHAWRILADSIARTGFDVLRLDYDGTGNSAGDYADPHRVDAWLRSVRHAMAVARDLSASRSVALVGLRAGALLALHAGAGADVDRLVLWSPFASGSECARETRALAALSRQDHAVADDPPDELNVAGHAISRSTLDGLSTLTPGAIAACPARDVLIVHRDGRTPVSAVAPTLTQLGCRVTEIRPDGTEAMLVPPQLATVPEAPIRAIVDWLAAWPVCSTNRRRAASSDAGHHASRVDGVLERTVRFGRNERLFGVLGTPHRPGSRAAIVFFNTGVEHHIGPHRMYVPLARQWVASGHVVLRFDIGGIGDSAPPPGATAQVAYPSHMFDDARAAIEFLRTSAPGRPVVGVGLCSGAWLAFRAAADGVEVDAVAAINPPLYLREPDGGAKWLAEGRELERYRQSIRAPQKWAKALRGQASISAFTRTVTEALSRRLAHRFSAAFAHTPPEGLARDLVAIAGRRIRTLLVFSACGDGLAYFEAHAQRAVRNPAVQETIRSVVVDGAGHSFRPRAAQHRVRELLTTFVGELGGGADADVLADPPPV